MRLVGWAWRTALGRTTDEVVGRLVAGAGGAAANPRPGYAVRVAAAIPGEPTSSRHGRFLRRMGLFAMEVAGEAFAMSRLRGGDRVGLFSGVGGLRAHWDDMMAGLANQRDDGRGAWDRGLRDVHPYWMLRHLSNNVHALAALELGLRGEGATYGGGNGGAQALAAAARALEDGAIDAALIVAYDSLLEPETLVELGARRAATHAPAGEVAAPYDERATGFVPGEAAAAVVVVRDADGAGATTAVARIDAIDGADGAAAEPSAATIGRAAARLAAGAGLVDGAARGWPALDAGERAAIGDLVASETPLTAITSGLGQLGAATAVVQVIALAELLRRGVVPPIAGLARSTAGPLVPATRAAALAARAAIGISTGAPGLVGVIRVELDPGAPRPRLVRSPRWVDPARGSR